MKEIERVLCYPKVLKFIEKRGVSFKEIDSLIKKIKKVSSMVAGELVVEVIETDPDDNIILACAVEGKTDFIVSGDKHLKDLKEFQGIRIVEPAMFLRVMEKLEKRG
jgi:putative PIN family toxin of toxin-antitoxin system